MIDAEYALSQKISMHFANSSAHGDLTSCAPGVRRLVLFSGALALVVLIFTAPALRSPTTPIVDLHDLHLKNELLAGSDALLERMVIPPYRPDWVLLSCSEREISAVTTEKVSLYDGVRRSLCEAARRRDEITWADLRPTRLWEDLKSLVKFLR